MGTTSDKLTYLSGTKDKLKTTINYTGANITNDTFRSYPEKLYNEYIDIINNGTGTLYSNMPKVNGQGDSITLNDTAEAPMKLDLKGNTEQDGTPTPSSPVDVNVVSGDNTIEICGKNLFNLNSFTTTSQSGITLTPTFENGKLLYITSSGTFSTTTYMLLKEIYNLKPSTQYTLSGAYSPSARLRLREYDINGNNLSEYYDEGNGVTFTSKSNVYKVNIQIVFYAQNNVKFYPMIEKGSTPTSYEAYKGQSQLISLGSIELCKISTYQDYIYKDNGKWYLHKEIGKVVLDGSETWAYDTTYKYFRCPTFNFGDDIPSTEESGRTTQMNTHFKLETSWATFRNSTTVNMIGFISNEGYKVFLRNVDYTTTTDFSNWLVNNNIPIYYVLATPTDTEITDSELLEQLNNLDQAKSYEGQTNISQTNNDLPFVIKASALKGAE